MQLVYKCTHGTRVMGRVASLTQKILSIYRFMDMYTRTSFRKYTVCAICMDIHGSIFLHKSNCVLLWMWLSILA